MAEGCLCKHCGKQETVHFDRSLDEDPSERLSGYRKSLAKCPGFTYKPDDLKVIVATAEARHIEGLESLARFRGAWGVFIAEASYLKTVAKAGVLKREYAQAKTPGEKRKIEARMEELRKPRGSYYYVA